MSNQRSTLEAALEGRYVIRRELGHGGMATVWLADDLRHGRPVAIKVLRPEIRMALGADRFLRETSIAASLAHPNILPLHDSGSAGQLLYYVMPVVDGESLRGRLLRDGRLPIGDAIRIAREAADALAYAHGRGVIHRDIKPENILFQAGHAMLSDFGIAWAIEYAADDRLTDTGMALGTPAYMSPEQATGARVIDGRSDIYALAVVLYEMLAGSPPFAAPTAMAILARQSLEAPPSVRAARKDVPAHVERALLKAMAKAAGDRFDTAGEFAAALATPAPRPDWFRASWRAAAAVVAVGAIAAAGWLTTHRAQPPAPVANRITAVGVLPLENLTGSGDQQYFVDAVHDAIITELQQVSALNVISRTSMMRYRSTTKTAPEIARELGVQALVEGSVTRRNDSIVIRVSVMRAVPSEQQLWTRPYAGIPPDIVKLERGIAFNIAQEVQAPVSADERDRLLRAHTVNPQAYQILARAVAEPYLTSASAARCIALADSAILIDHRYAPAWERLSRCYAVLPLISGGLSPAEAFPKAREAAQRALELDANLPGAHSALGYALAVSYDFTGAEREYRRAIALNRGETMGWFLAWMGRFDEAISEAGRAELLNPMSAATAQNTAAILYVARRYDQSIAASLRSISLDSTYAFAYERLGRAYDALGRYDQAAAAYSRGMQLSDGDRLFVAGLARIYALTGRKAEAQRMLAGLINENRVYVSPSTIASVFLALGENDSGIAWLERGFAVRDGNMVLLKVWPELDPIRSDPRYQSLLRRMNFPD